MRVNPNGTKLRPCVPRPRELKAHLSVPRMACGGARRGHGSEDVRLAEGGDPEEGAEGAL